MYYVVECAFFGSNSCLEIRNLHLEYIRVAPSTSSSLDMAVFFNKYAVVLYGVLICISLLISNVKYLFVSLFGIYLFGEVLFLFLFPLVTAFYDFMIIGFWEYIYVYILNTVFCEIWDFWVFSPTLCS